MPQPIALIGVPSSAGAHGPGQEKAPAALRAAGLVRQLEARGIGVVDRGDLPRARFRPDPEHRRAQNLAEVVEVARGVAGAVEAALGAGELPVVVGGDCSITLGVVSGLRRAGGDLALLYMDGGVDVGTPATYRPGIFDSMGVAHLVGEAGAADELARLGPVYPLLPGRFIVPYGYTPGDPIEAERAIFARHGIAGVTDAEVRGGAEAAAVRARDALKARAPRYLLHFDVDVIDFVDLPVADVPHINAGITLDDALTSLRVFAADPAFEGLVITEFNPDHDEDAALASSFVNGLAEALAAALAKGDR